MLGNTRNELVGVDTLESTKADRLGGGLTVSVSFVVVVVVVVYKLRLGIGNLVNKDLARAKDSSEKRQRLYKMTNTQGDF